MGDEVSQAIIDGRAQGISAVDVYRDFNAAAKEDNPWSYGGGQLAGGIGGLATGLGA